MGRSALPRLQVALLRRDPGDQRAVAEVVADVQPDIAFMLWGQDHHDDHVVASQLSEIALRSCQPFIGQSAVEEFPGGSAAYDNGPRHTIGFVPDTFVDVTPEWDQAIDWLGQFMALVRNEPYKPGSRDSAQHVKEALAAYRGITCGTRYAEALWSLNQSPRDIL